jgi:hypothetical protein
LRIQYDGNRRCQVPGVEQLTRMSISPLPRLSEVDDDGDDVAGAIVGHNLQPIQCRHSHHLPGIGFHDILGTPCSMMTQDDWQSTHVHHLSSSSTPTLTTYSSFNFVHPLQDYHAQFLVPLKYSWLASIAKTPQLGHARRPGFIPSLLFSPSYHLNNIPPYFSLIYRIHILIGRRHIPPPFQRSNP